MNKIKETLKKIFEKKQNIAIILIVIGILIRGYFFFFNPLDINVDEAMIAVNAKSIAEKGVDMYGTSYPVYLEAWRIWWTECCLAIYDCNML